MLRPYILLPHGRALPSSPQKLKKKVEYAGLCPTGQDVTHPLGWVPSKSATSSPPVHPNPQPMQSLVLAAEPEHDKRFYLPSSQCSKSIPPWPGSHWLKETLSLIKTGRGPANMAHSYFPSWELKERKERESRKKQQEKRRETDVPKEPRHPMDQAPFVLALALSFPWLCLSKERLGGWGWLRWSSPACLLRASHVTWNCSGSDLRHLQCLVEKSDSLLNVTAAAATTAPTMAS